MLISTYDLGRQPFGLASPAAWLREAGHEVDCLDLSVQPLAPASIRQADLVAFYLPMHTATRLAIPVIERVRRVNPAARLCCYGLYAPLNEVYLRTLGVSIILGGEFEGLLMALANGQEHPPDRTVPLERLSFRRPDRSGLPPLDLYGKLQTNSGSRLAGYTEASRGCKHLCRHCPVVNVYKGVFRVVQAEIVLDDVRQQVEAGAAHITFGDPDFLNGPKHAIGIVEALHREWPTLTYDFTAKIEHLRLQRSLLPLFRDTNCLFVTSAVESLDDMVLGKLEKGHTRADFQAVVSDFRAAGLTLAPTFIAFTPWTTRASYRELLRAIADLDLVEATSSVQLALRLLIPRGSRLLELPEILERVTGYDEAALLYRWRHTDPDVDRLAEQAMRIAARQTLRPEAFRELWELAHAAAPPEDLDIVSRATVPYLEEPWYC